MERKNAWKKYSDEDKNNVFTFADEYKTFISECKTERECVKKAVELAKKAGYRDLQEIIAANETLKAGDKALPTVSSLAERFAITVAPASAWKIGRASCRERVSSPV